MWYSADWENVFRAILDLPYGPEKKLVVIDEFPYMCRTNRSIPSILQNLWDSELKERNVMIILCGSSLNDKSPYWYLPFPLALYPLKTPAQRFQAL